jgi:flagellar secretion chaperone FliS
MYESAHDTYLESRILSADSVELVKMMYQASIAAVRDARRHLANHDIAARARAISKANRILTELTVSLDHERGGELSQGLERLYGYMNRRLIDANFRQADGPLEEVLGLLLTLAEGWDGVQPVAKPDVKSVSPWGQMAEQAPPPEQAATYDTHSWSL